MKSLFRFASWVLPALVVATLAPASAHAIIITTSIGDYEVSTVQSDLASLEATFEQQIWWEDAALAHEFAALTNTAFGAPNFGIFAPFFWYTFTDTTGPCAGIGEPLAGAYWDVRLGTTTQICAATPSTTQFTFAVAEAVGVPEPSALALCGLGMIGLGVAGRRRTAAHNVSA